MLRLAASFWIIPGRELLRYISDRGGGGGEVEISDCGQIASPRH